MSLRYASEEHVARLLGHLQQLMVEGQHCQVELQCEDGSLPVPGMLLAAISPFFKVIGTTYDSEVINIIMPDFQVSLDEQD